MSSFGEMENIQQPMNGRDSLAVLERGSLLPQSKTRRQFGQLSRSALARERAAAARAMLADCHFCAHHCGGNRLAGELGLCHAGAEARFFLAQTEVTDELELIPTFAIALSGCDLRCDFCISGAESWNPRAGENFNAGEMADRAKAALRKGSRTVMVLGGEPTIHLPAALELVAALPDLARLVWKTNAYGSAQARELLDGMFDVWLADYKFGNDDCARRLAKISDYTNIVRGNLLWFAGSAPASGAAGRASRPGSMASERAKPLDSSRTSEVFREGAENSTRGACAPQMLGAPAHGELIVRHLLMPGHVDCCWHPVAKWLAENLPGVKVNLRSGFWPAWKSARHLKLHGTVPDAEARRAEQIADFYRLNLIP